MIHRRIAGVVTVALLSTGCGATATAVQGDDSGVTGDAAAVDCGGSRYDPTELADAPPASSLPEGPAGAVDDVGAPALDGSLDWKVVHETDDRVDLVRELDEPFDSGDGDVRTHEARTLERITGSSDVPDGTWMLMSAGPCAQRLITADDVGDADLTVARNPSPGDTAIELLVHERACASGRSAEGRIELLELTATTEEIQVRIGVRPQAGDQSCQGNPPTPFTIDLDEPLGDRVIVDASVLPPRAVTLDTIL